MQESNVDGILMSTCRTCAAFSYMHGGIKATLHSTEHVTLTEFPF